MMVLGADTHKGSHSIAAVASGDRRAARREDRRASARRASWRCSIGRASSTRDRVWALEDCRHVSGSLERFLLISGERVVRVSTKLMAGARRGASSRGKSDVIDALAVARAALREGHRVVADRAAGRRRARDPAARRSSRAARSPARRAQQRPALEPARSLARAQAHRQPAAGQDAPRRTSLAASRAPSRPPAFGSPATSCGACASSPPRPPQLEAEIADLVAQAAPQLLAEPGFGPLTDGEVDRRDRRRRPLQQRRQARSRRRRCADPGQLRQDQPPPPRPRRQPPTQRRRFTASRSPAPAATPKPATTSLANAPKARPNAKRCAASNDTSFAASGTCSRRPRQTIGASPNHIFLDIGAAKAAAGSEWKASWIARPTVEDLQWALADVLAFMERHSLPMLAEVRRAHAEVQRADAHGAERYLMLNRGLLDLYFSPVNGNAASEREGEQLNDEWRALHDRAFAFADALLRASR